MTALFDFPSLIVVILLLICACTYIRDKRPGIYEDPSKPGTQTGLLSFGWKASRVGERLSPWVSAACMAMAFHTLFIK